MKGRKKGKNKQRRRRKKERGSTGKQEVFAPAPGAGKPQEDELGLQCLFALGALLLFSCWGCSASLVFAV